MKKFTREELQENATRLLAAHKKDKLFATQDGNYFLLQNDAMFHNNGIKQENREWDGEIIPFDNKTAETVVAEEPVKEKSAELVAAEDRVRTANLNLVADKKAMDKADKASLKKPNDKALQKAAEEAKTVYESAQLEVDNANTALTALINTEVV